MKKILLFVAVLAVGLTSCSDDDDKKGIIGKWTFDQTGLMINDQEEYEAYQHSPGCPKDYIEFDTDDIARNVQYETEEIQCFPNEDLFTWSKDGDTLTLTSGGVTSTFEIITLSNSTLKLKYVSQGTAYYSIFKRQ